MAKNAKDEKKPNRRTEVNALPQQKKELSQEEAKKVKGGILSSYLWVGSAKPTGGGSGSSG